VDAAQEGGLAAAGGADQSGDRPLGDVQANVEQRLLAAVEDADVAGAHLGLGARAGGGRIRGAVAGCVVALGGEGAEQHRLHQRLSKRRRSTTAARFITIMKASSTRMAAAVRSWNARSEAFSQMNTCTGSTVAAEV